MLPARFRRSALAACLLLGACNDTSDLAPASPDTPWQFEPSGEAPAAAPTVAAGARQFAVPENTAVQLPSPTDIEPNHTYSLVELIDLAERRNPATRVAWEQARQAAINVGIARAAYLPALTASAIAGWEHAVFPFPSNLIPQGFITANAQEVFPQLTVNYLLFDFGGRAAAVEGAAQLSIAGNVAFTAAHQQLIFDVARAYFTLDGVDAALRAAQQALADAKVVQQSAEAQFGRGLNTVVDVQLARRATAQAQYDLAQAKTAQHDAMYTLLAAMDLPPTTNLHVASASERPLPPRTARTVDDVLSEALRRRPDLLAGVAKLRASDAEIAAARSALLPKASLSANVQGNIGQLSVDNTPYLGVVKPQWAALLKLEWPLYEGGLLQNKLTLAQAKREEAAAALKERTDQALREVALAYDQVDTGLQQYEAAIALQTASEAAFHSASDSYAHGVGTLIDATSAQTGLATARAAVARAHAQSLINAAALAFATGELTSSADFSTTRPR
ncbi:MAG TPA: TolC family protein [Stellaceae bacterium]|nr:TolC family protein [Stellaceae bacterium]